MRRTRNSTALALVATLAAAALTASLALPLASAAFTLSGESLGLAQRDARVFNTFTDASANDNTVPHPNFPGASGATLAIWKAHTEWGSGPWAGDGLGDGLASNAQLGDGGANFDTVWQGTTTDAAGSNGNVHVAVSGLGGGVLAFTATPITDGWKITYNDDLLWDDGPGLPVAGALDLQAVATHEIGHALGLGHSAVAGATMFASGSGSALSARSIEADDRAGLQAIYGVAAASKPRITALSGALVTGGAISIHGLNFAATGNEVWFTKLASDGVPVKLVGLVGLAGGTRLDLAVPPGTQAGALHVKVPGSSGAALSNGFPIALDFPPGSFALTEAPKAGSLGLLPLLSGSGDLTSGSGAFTLFLQNFPAAAMGQLFVGSGEGNVPFKGGVFDPLPLLLTVPIALDASGALTLPATMPSGLPAGTELVLQALVVDLGADGGVGASNGLRLEIP
ncbi:MAG: matrixin family metalloprotease [Planctomycetota bacterium]